MTCQPCVLPEQFRSTVNRMTPLRIINAVCLVYDVTYDQLRAPNRGKEEIADARHMAMYLMRRHTKMSLKGIAGLFRRDHTTVMHAQRRIDTEKGVRNGVDIQQYHKEKYRQVMELLR